MDLGFRQCARGRVEQRPAQVEVVARELEIEEGRFPFLVLRRGRQHVVGKACRFGHGDVDHDHGIERAQRLAKARGFRQRMRRVRALDQHAAIAVGVIAEDLLRDDVARYQATDDRRAGHRAALAGGAAAEQALDRRGNVLRAALREIAGQQPEQLFQVADERGVAVHLHAEVLEAGHAAGSGDAPRREPHLFLGDAAGRARGGDRYGREPLGEGLDARGACRDPAGVRQSFLPQHAEHRVQQPGVGAGPGLQVDVGQLGRLGAHRIDHDQRACRVAGDLAQRDACTRDAVRLPGVLAQEDRHLAVLEIGANAIAEQASVDPELPGLLLRQRVGAVARAECAPGRGGIGARQVIALSAAAVIEDARTGMTLAQRREAGRDLANGGIPVDGLEAAVVAPAQRLRDAVGPVLVVIEPARLLAQVAPRRGVRLVAAGAHDMAPVVAAELHFHAAVALAEYAGGLLPVIAHGVGLLRGLRVSEHRDRTLSTVANADAPRHRTRRALAGRAGSEHHLGSEFDHPVRRKAEVAGRALGLAHHPAEQCAAP